MPNSSESPSLEATEQELSLRLVIDRKYHQWHQHPSSDRAKAVMASLQAWRSVIEPGSSGPTPAMIRRNALEDAAHLAEAHPRVADAIRALAGEQ